MKTRNNLNNTQESILDTLDLIKETPVNSFFKQRVLKQLLQEKDLKESSFVWVNPKFQLATFVVLLCLNIGAISLTISSTETSAKEKLSEFDSFVEEYNLETINYISIQ